MNAKMLEKFGLSEKESQVYLGLLELGASTVADIAAKAKINRTTAYDILEPLVNHGLIGRVGEKKKKMYVAEHPEQLIVFLEQKSKEFDEKSQLAKNILPELKDIYNSVPHRPRVKFYEGEGGIKNIYEDSLASRTEILSWLNAENAADFAKEYFDEYYKRRAAKKIHIKAIVNDSQEARKIRMRNFLEDRESRLVPTEKMNIKPECYVYDEKVAFMSLKEKFGVIIESKDIADAQRKLYELAWDKAKEYDTKSDK